MNLKVGQTDREAQLADLLCVELGTRSTNLFAFGTSADNFTRFEDERCGLRLADPHNASSEALWIILAVLGLKSDGA